jgi:SAM-dependent methyltransferase
MRTTCRACENPGLKCILDMGLQPSAGDYLTKERVGKEPLFPLRLFWCTNCGLLQLVDIVPPTFLFNSYNYESSTTTTLRKHFEKLAYLIVNKLYAKKVLEIGCNDGVLLLPLKQLGATVLGVDPAQNIVAKAKANGLDVICSFFTPILAKAIVDEYGRFDVVTGSNVFAHIDDMKALLEGVRMVLKDGGTFIFEVHNARSLLEELQYDSIYHEHVSYFTKETANTLLANNGFEVFETERTSMHGGGLRLYARKGDFCSLVYEANADEAEAFGPSVAAHCAALRDVLAEYKRVVGYGAPGRGNTLLNYCSIGPSQLEYITDASSLRYNKFTPGSHIPIYSEAAKPLATSQADAALVLAWTYLPEIMKKEKEYLEAGGKFIVPFPWPRVVTG